MPATPRRATRALALRRRMLANRGNAVECPVCERRFARFRDDWNRANAICWRCGSHERHRALWLYLERHPELLSGASRCSISRPSGASSDACGHCRGSAT